MVGSPTYGVRREHHPPLKVLLVDDDGLMRAGLRAVLSSDETIKVVGEASNGRQAVDRVRALGPDLVLMDVRMPDLDGIAATREVLAASPDVKVVILTTFEQVMSRLSEITRGCSPDAGRGKWMMLTSVSPWRLRAGCTPFARAPRIHVGRNATTGPVV